MNILIATFACLFDSAQGAAVATRALDFGVTHTHGKCERKSKLTGGLPKM